MFGLALTAIATATSIIAASVIPAPYWPNSSNGGYNAGAISMYGTVPSGTLGVPYIEVGNTGAIVYRWQGAGAATCAILGHICWWPRTLADGSL